jgi:uncharacterized protein
MDGFSLALLTDVHIGPTVSRGRVEQIVNAVNTHLPGLDAVTVVGDLVDGFLSNLEQRAMPLQKLRSKWGVFFATGNHEYYHGDVDEWVEFFRRRLNMTVLRNQHFVVEVGWLGVGGGCKDSNSKVHIPSFKKNLKLQTRHPHTANQQPTSQDTGGLCIVGVDDLVTEHLYIPGHRMDPVKAVEGCPATHTIIMLAHQPNAARRILDGASRRIDLILSGHTHGGQFYIFWPMAWLRNAFLHGLYEDLESGAQIYVSSGVNYWGPPVKMWDLCEIVHLTLRRGPETAARGLLREDLGSGGASPAP